MMIRLFLIGLLALFTSSCVNGLKFPVGSSEPSAAYAPSEVNEPPPTAVAEVDSTSSADIASSNDTSPDSPLASINDPNDAETTEVETLDPETLEDNELLSEVDQDVPADEGITVQQESVVFDFPVVENEKVRHFIQHYSGPGRKTFARWLERSGRYIPLMRKIFAEEGLPEDLAYLALVESGFNTRAYSWAHAVGPWQFIESTGTMFGLENSWWHDERRDFEKSTRAAARFLKDLNQQFDGNWYLAVAAYNAGSGKIRRAIKQYKTHDFWELSRGKYLQTETKNYVPKLLAALMIAKNPEAYGFDKIDYYEPISFDVATLPTATDLELVAGLCGASYDEIKDLNPELKRWCTPPGVKNYQIRIPAGTADEFRQKYAQVPQDERAKYKRHRIQKGDTLLALAKRYHIRVNDIISLNKISNPRVLRVGTDLILPLKKGASSIPLEELADDYQRSHRKSYTVRSGDSLWKIGRRFGVSEKQLRVWNRLGWSNTIRPGQTLLVSSQGRSVRSRTVASHTSKDVRKIIYTVQAGDTLWDIARQFEVATRSIKSWNNLSEAQIIRPGQKLVVFSAVGSRTVASNSAKDLRKIIYKVQAGDTLWGIGRQFEVATQSIKSWNNLSDGHILRPGDSLTLLVAGGGQG